MIRLIATDLDGTLLNSNQRISEANRISIKKAIEKGITIVLATGRPIAGVREYVKELGLDKGDHYVISNTGAYIHSTRDESIIRKNVMDAEDYKQIAKVTKGFDVQLTAYGHDEIWNNSQNHNESVLLDARFLEMPLIYMDLEHIPDDFEAARINIMGSEQEITDAVNSIDKEILGNYYTVRNEWFSYEILNKDAGKGNCIVALAKILGISLQDIMAFGDGYNDLEMLNMCGHSVAMGNSRQILKDNAVYTTKSNDEDGVSHIINSQIFHPVHKCGQ